MRELALPFGRTLRVVQLHRHPCGAFHDPAGPAAFAEQVIALQPDLFVLTGDYITNSIAFLPEIVEEMVRVRARYGTFATLGNHDHWYAESGELTAVFRQHRIPLLRNAHRVIHPRRALPPLPASRTSTQENPTSKPPCAA